jgi:hypothetical protein
MKVFFLIITTSVIFQTGCSCSPRDVGPTPQTISHQLLSNNEAAQLAARLANDECERRFKKHPFVAEQYPAVLRNGMYRWGGLDVGGKNGYSARVSFRQDGSEPHTEVYFSSDQLMW